jgi:integrase
MFLRKVGKTYHVYYEVSKGIRTSISTKETNYNLALKFLSRFKDEMEARKKGKIKLIQFKEYLKLFIELKKPVVTLSVIQGYKALFRTFGSATLKKLTIDLMPSELQLPVLKHLCKESTKREYLRKLVSLVNQMKSDKVLTGDFELLKIKWNIQEKPIKYFSIDMFKRFYNECKYQFLKEMALTSINSGMRISEITNLQWSDIDIENQTIRILKQKNKKFSYLPMNETLIQLFKEKYLSRVNDGYIWQTQNKSKSFITKIEYILKMELKRIFGNEINLTFHGFRHSYATYLLQQGTPIIFVSK